ncbi:hypothetical protein Agub_g11027 [Astrephomene gubernaculifera]|uniref:Uncharacterized protein n=1 Tax=Astrephomene gubernaculifera TaxID=47775 RepID=A0AAD3E093_9CHLO|nr:hypothetical protein Agub_g11027 [Astrephomene gubernaculifera]
MLGKRSSDQTGTIPCGGFPTLTDKGCLDTNYQIWFENPDDYDFGLDSYWGSGDALYEQGMLDHCFAFFTKLLGNVLVALRFVLSTKEVQRLYLVLWELLKNLLMLQASSAGNLLQLHVLNQDQTAEQVADSDADEDDDDVGNLGMFVVMRSPGAKEKTFNSLEDALNQGSKPVLVVKVKHSIQDSTEAVWQPLACALELADYTETDQPVWVLVTDLEKWHFYQVRRVKRRPARAEGYGSHVSKFLYTAERKGGFKADFRRPVTGDAGLTRLLVYMYRILYPGKDIEVLKQDYEQSTKAIQEESKEWFASAKAAADLGAAMAAEKARAEAEKARAEAEKARAEAAEAEIARLRAQLDAIAQQRKGQE